MTAAKDNSELKLWCTVKWTCLQTIRSVSVCPFGDSVVSTPLTFADHLLLFSFLHPPGSISQPKMLLGLDLSASYLFVADTSRAVCVGGFVVAFLFYMYCISSLVLHLLLKVFYIIPVNQEAAIGDASFSSVTEYLLTQPIFKFVISGRPRPYRPQEENEEDDDEEDDRKEIKPADEKEMDARKVIAMIKLHCMHPKSAISMDGMLGSV